MSSSVELGQRHLREFNERRFTRADLAKFVAEDVVGLAPATGQEFNGLDGVMAFNQSWVTTFSDAQCEDIEAVDEGDHAALHFRGTGTFDGDFPTPQGTVTGDGSHRVNVAFTNLYWAEDGKITRIEGHFDPGDLMRQMGLA